MSERPAPPASPDSLLSAWRLRRPALEGLVRALDDAAYAALEGTLDRPSAARAADVAGELDEGLTAFGLDHGARLAGEAARILERGGESDEEGLLRLTQILELVRQEVAVATPPAAEAEAAEPHGDLGLVVLPDDLAVRVEAEALRRGFRPRRLDPGDLAPGRLARRPLDGLVLYLDGDSDRSLAVLETGAGTGLGIPSVAVSQNLDFDDRVLAARIGIGRIVSPPFTAEGLVDAVEEVRTRTCGNGARVLAVDDDPGFLAMARTLLATTGVGVETLEDATRFWDVLEATDPDLLLLDVNLPDVDGLELCRMVRSDLGWAHLPVVFITGSDDDDTVDAIFGCGGDDYIHKPPRPAELVVRVTSRLARARFLKRLLHRDLLTDLPNRARFAEELGRLVSVAEREGLPVAVAAVHLDDLEEANDRFGPATADRMIRRLADILRDSVGEGEVVGRIAGAEFMMAFLGQAGEDVRGVIDGVRRRVGSEPLPGPGGDAIAMTVSAGIVDLPEGGASPRKLMRSASELAREARRGGSSGTSVPGAEAGVRPRVDVLVVEDDAAVAELLLHALESRGLSVRWIAHGGEALEALIGEAAMPWPRVILLDVGLPGMDVLHVLQRLHEAGVTRRTQVLMLTTRTAEQEVLRALELGAFDHLPKPFSLPIVLRRVDLALRS